MANNAFREKGKLGGNGVRGNGKSYVNTIEKAGGHVVCDTGPIVAWKKKPWNRDGYAGFCEGDLLFAQL